MADVMRTVAVTTAVAVTTVVAAITAVATITVVAATMTVAATITVAAAPAVVQTAHVMTGEMIVIITALLSQAVMDRSCRLRQCQDRSQEAFIIFQEQQAVAVKSN